MFTKTIAAGHRLLIVLFVYAGLLTPVMAAPPTSSAGLEFPVTMRQNVAAGSTPAGTKVEAKLAVATLVDGVVVPQGAILSGEVTESVAKSAAGPSHLAIRMDSAHWKNGSAPKVLQLPSKVYLTAWYYPALAPSPQDQVDQLADASVSGSGRRSGAPPNSTATYPAPNSPASQPFPGRDPDRNRDTISPSPMPGSSLSQRRVVMKNMESTRNPEGAVTLICTRSNIKLDKTTTYVFAAGGLAQN